VTVRQCLVTVVLIGCSITVEYSIVLHGQWSVSDYQARIV